MSTERDRLKARIAALLAKTVENGCTEGEALSAAAKVAELLDRHALSLSDVEIRESPCERVDFASRAAFSASSLSAMPFTIPRTKDALTLWRSRVSKRA